MGEKCEKKAKNVLKIHKIWEKMGQHKTCPKNSKTVLKLAKNSPKTVQNAPKMRSEFLKVKRKWAQNGIKIC